MDEIDKSKENIQPLRQGRNPEQLCDALSELKQRKHVAQMQQYEMRLRTYEGEDPLEPWFTYITWMEQTSTGRGKQFREVLKQCLKTFSGEQAYHNDSRLVELWLKYLSVQPNRMELYETVLGHGIGIQSAHFYQRWAADLEAAGDLRGADKIYQRGLSEDLDSRDVLDQALQRFQMRAAKTKPDESLCDTNASQRAVLGRLESRDGKVPAERPQIRPMGENRPMVKPIKEKSAFPVFMGGENEKPRRQLMKEIPDEKARVENETAPKRWNEAASGKEARPVTLTTPFKVLEDPTEAPASAKFTASKRVLQEVKCSKPEADEFPLAYFEPVNEKVKPMYCKDKIYCGGTEFSFEELRAMTWQKKKAARAAKLAKEMPRKEEAPSARKEIIMYETVRNGQEWSHEELRAQAFLAKMTEKIDCPLALFEPDNPNQVRMYDKQRVYSDNTEYSPEELRAKDWVARSQSGLLGQSMTVHTREALAAMQDLWQSTRESPPASPPKAAFNIYQDSKKAAPFAIFSDECKPVAPFPIYTESDDVEVPMKQDSKVFSYEAKPVAPFQIYSENNENQAASSQNGAFEIYSENVKSTIPFQIYSENCTQKGDVIEKAPFGVYSDNEENVHNALQRLTVAENYGKVLQPKFETMLDEANEDDDEEEEEGEEPFEVKPLPPLPELPYVPPPSDWESNGPEGKENSSHLFVPKRPKHELFPDDEDTHFMVGPLGMGNMNDFDDVTVGLMMRPPPVESSTPFTHQPQSLLTMQPQETRHTMLSPILEMTGESRGSRSSSSSGASSHCSKGFSFNLKTPGQSLVNEATHSTVAQVRLELLEEEEEVSNSSRKGFSQDMAMDNPWSQDLQKQLMPYVEGVLYFDGPLPSCRVGNNLRLGKKSFRLKKILGEGAYGKVYRAEEPLVIKCIPNDTTAWEMHISRSLRSRVAPHLLEHFCEVSSMAIYSNGSMMEMPFKSEMTLLNAINLNQNFSETTKAFLTSEILKVTEALMDAKIIHADIKPDNFILIPIKYGKTFRYHLQLIDFGRCIDLNLLPNARFTSSLKGDTRCVAMRQQKPWSYDLDHYSAAATIHVVLFSKYLTPIEVRSVWKPTCKPKRFWGLAGVFEKLLEVLINSSFDARIEFDEFIIPLFQLAQADEIVVNAELDAVFSLLA